MFALPRTLLPRRAPALLQKRSIYIEFQIPPPRGRPRRPNYNRFQQHKQTLRQPLVRRWLAGTAAAATGFYVYNLETVPITGRRRFNIISPATEAQLAGQMFQATMDEFRGRVLPRDHPAVKRVRRVMERLQGVSGLDEGGWEVFVVRDEGVRNAFVVPG